jgi:hypothetical protein
MLLFLGHQSVFHTGNLHAYTTYAALYPQAKSGFFIIVNGPWPLLDLGTDLEPLYYVLADILLQEDQWLNVSTVCSFPEPWEEKPTKEPVTDISTDDYNFTPCLGNYGHAIYGDIVISSDSSNGKLSFKINTVGEGHLNLLFSENSTFQMNFVGRISFIFNDLGCEAHFSEQADGLFQKLQINCLAEYDFHRGVSFLGEYGPTSSSLMICNMSVLIISMLILQAFVQLYND